MIYDLYIEKQKADIDQTISIQLSYAIDDINRYGSRETSFSKQIVLTGTDNNNKIFGHILKPTSANPYTINLPNVNENFNPSDISLAELRMNGLLILKGVFRLTSIQLKNGVYSYEGVLFGELGGFITAIGNQRLEDLDFSAYDHVYNETNIQGSWDSINGSSYYYPLIDYGTYSTNKVDYDIRTFRPALYVKEYIDKLFAAAGYTYESSFFDTARFKSLIIPNNTKRLTKLSNSLLNADFAGSQVFTGAGADIEFDTAIGGNFTINVGNSEFTYNQSQSIYASHRLFVAGTATLDGCSATISIVINNVEVASIFLADNAGTPYLFGQAVTFSGLLNLNDVIRIEVNRVGIGALSIDLEQANYDITVNPPTIVNIDYGDTININDTIPKGIFQRDFFTWIVKMFNLYIDEDKLKDKHLIIEPFTDYYDYSNRLNWEQKIDYSKAVEFIPMGQLNGRFFEYKYKQDNDFYNEGYQKKYNQSYGDILYDTGFQFSKDRQTVEIGFSPSVLVQYTATDKVVPAIYKKSTGNDIDQEELTDSNIRIMYAKKVTGVTNWNLKDGVTSLSVLSFYGYAGHLDDPTNPTFDLNFGAPSEIFFTPNTYTGNGLFNEYWNRYVQEIANKDSKLLKAYAYLTLQDIIELDFSKPVYIGGALWRLNKVEDWDITNPVVRVELLKIINAY